MTTRAATVEAQLSPGVTFRAPHGRQVLVGHPDEGMTPTGVRMRPCGRPGRRCGNQEHRASTQRHRFYALAFPEQPPTYGSVKVLSCGTTMATALSNEVGLKPLKPVKGLYPKPEGLGFYALSHKWLAWHRRCNVCTVEKDACSGAPPWRRITAEHRSAVALQGGDNGDRANDARDDRANDA